MNQARLTGKVAIVTGAPRSIGRAIAQSLADEGAAVAVHYRSRREEAEATVADLQARGAQAVAIGGDLSDSSNVRELFSQTQQAFGGVDIVMANAGATTDPGPVAAITDETFEHLLSANTRATFFVLREAARVIRDGGRIINVSSSSVHFSRAGFGAYATSKTGANTTIRILAAELGNRGITANTVMAGPIAAGFLDPSSAVVQNAPAGALEELAASAPTGRLGLPGDIAGVAAFLAGPEAGWVTGQIILTNGGATV